MTPRNRWASRGGRLFVGLTTDMDKLTPEQRRRAMSAVRSANTTPELAVRSFLHRAGFRFRLHRKDLPGRPDIVLPKRRLAIFVHGCFWHQHPGCRRATVPASRQGYWLVKLARNVHRDGVNVTALEKLGWRVLVVWECETKVASTLARRLHEELPSIKPL